MTRPWIRATIWVTCHLCACGTIVIDPGESDSSTGVTTITVAGSGAPCVDTASDPANCGACGHSCLGGACSAGVCQPVVVVDGQSASAIAVDHEAVYWTTFKGAVFKIAKSGGEPVELAPPDPMPYPTAIAVDDTYVYWPTPYGKILRAPKTPGKVTTLVSGLSSPESVALAGDDLYYSDAAGAGRIPKAGGAATTLWTGPASWASVDAENLYVTAGEEYEGDLLQLPRAGGTPTTLFSSKTLEIYVANVATTATDVLWIAGSPPSLQRVPIGGGPVTVVAANAFTCAVDADFVYWGDGSSDEADPTAGQILRAPLGGGPPTALATQQVPGIIAVDEEAVYWTNWDESASGCCVATSIMKVAK